jgi:hypothetical protein
MTPGPAEVYEPRRRALLYDRDGNRVAKTVNGVTTRYPVDDLNPTGYALVVEESANGAVQRSYTYGLQRIDVIQLSQFQIGTVAVTYCQNLPLIPARFATLKVGPNKALKATEHHSVAFLC